MVNSSACSGERFAADAIAGEGAAPWRTASQRRFYLGAHFGLAAILAHLDRLNEARAAVQAGLALNPSLTISRLRAQAASDNPTYLVQRERIYEGLRKAGVPEG
jgi:hypothetical protein